MTAASETGARMPDLGNAGVLAPGRWRWLRALGWMLALLVISVLVLSLQSVARAYSTSADLVLAMAFVCTLLAYGLYAILVSWGERRRVSELALSRLPAELGAGLAIGGGLMAAIMAVMWITGLYRFSAGDWTDWAHDIRETLGTGLLEELLFRLIVFRLIARAFGVRWGLAITSLAFGLAHLHNPHSSLMAALAIAVEAGLMLAAFYLLTGRIWMAVGVHAAWNFTQGAIFGARVSGMDSQGSLLVAISGPNAPAILTGGAFGPEASLVAMLVGLAAFLVVWQVIVRQSDRESTRALS